MAKETHTKTHNIFLLNREDMQNRFDPTHQLDIYGLLDAVMEMDNSYKEQNLKENIDTNGFSVKLYFRGDDNYQSKFASFCKDFVKEDQEAVTYFPRSASSVLFVWSDNHIFAITTGQGFRMIQDFAVPRFGLIIASAYSGHFKITSLNSNAMSSIIHSSKTIYTNEVDFVDVNALDTVFKEITGRLKDSTNVKTLLNLKPTSKRNSMKITAKDYVQFSSALNFSGLIHLLSIIDTYNYEILSDKFNLITPMTTKRYKDIVAENNIAVMNAIYNAVIGKTNFPFDLFHKDTEAYIDADQYVIYNGDTMDEYGVSEDYDALGLLQVSYAAFLDGNEVSKETFHSFLRAVRLQSRHGDYMSTDGTIMDHISGEIESNGINYYIFYGEYYRLNSTYSERLNESLSGKLRPEFYTDEIKTAWPVGENEDFFNENASIQCGYIHLHRVLSDHIEFADLLKVDGEYATIVHVKDGFNNDMRALDRQVELSVARIMELKHNNRSDYFEELYDFSLKKNTGITLSAVFSSKEDFIKCMKEKKLRYIIVIRPAKKELMENTSNIAKHCLNALILRCFNQGIELRVQVV